MNEEDEYRSLLNKMAAKRAFERIVLVFVALCALGIIGLLFVQDRELKQQSIAANARFAARSQAELQQTAKIESYIQCIAEFFAQPNRANLTLNNLQACQFATQPSSSSTNQYATVPKQPQPENPNAQQPTTSEPPTSSTVSKPQSSPTSSASQPASSSQTTAPMSLLQRAVGALTGLVKTLAVI